MGRRKGVGLHSHTTAVGVGGVFCKKVDSHSSAVVVTVTTRVRQAFDDA